MGIISGMRRVYSLLAKKTENAAEQAAVTSFGGNGIVMPKRATSGPVNAGSAPRAAASPPGLSGASQGQERPLSSEEHENYLTQLEVRSREMLAERRNKKPKDDNVRQRDMVDETFYDRGRTPELDCEEQRRRERSRGYGMDR